jgi:uncharacterized protein
MHNKWHMEVTFDPVKNASKVRDRNLPFALVEQCDWAGAVVEEDTRKAYGERRFRVLGFIGERLRAVVFTPRAGKVHVISLRNANPREVKKYAQTFKS